MTSRERQCGWYSDHFQFRSCHYANKTIINTMAYLLLNDGIKLQYRHPSIRVLGVRLTSRISLHPVCELWEVRNVINQCKTWRWRMQYQLPLKVKVSVKGCEFSLSLCLSRGIDDFCCAAAKPQWGQDCKIAEPWLTLLSSHLNWTSQVIIICSFICFFAYICLKVLIYWRNDEFLPPLHLCNCDMIVKVSISRNWGTS